MEKRHTLRRREVPRQALEGVPQLSVPEAALVDEKVAFEHAAPRAEGLDADFDPSPPSQSEFL
jgi:hypothetical protein